MERYVAEKNLSFKVFLLVVLKVAHPNVEVVFLPHNTNYLIQLLNQGLI